ncbi:right-handed parallel beta-helix repeat-containing protein [Aquimarina sp. MMG015]|uniref:right-handed parallel beta-helix repeat-containing protein n=1 Tax=Aquimarina sp. MMG015 TaxID=2822689 RepID=UPI001B3A154E|nr:right-handed parallel beta-helix repeat-containing protein [Aquimarina sp. MMG015]MBQ4802008.1 right-handed parallel beta-helix repeat-containing protein [Aquimarina sp. MMG015]
MKKLPYFLLIVFTISFFACSTENIEDVISEDEEVIEDEDDDQEEEEDDEIISDTLCDFDLSGLAANSTVTIDCLLDLEGQTINLPPNVTFDFDGGDIFNGTLIFSGGTIDGRLLNSKLGTEGNVNLKDPVFKFTATRWGNIVQGQTTSDIALKNTAEFENLMIRIKEMGGTTFETNVFDAFFETTKVTSTTADQNFYASVEAINVPSDFHLKMSNNTNLRQFPAAGGIENGTVIAVRDSDNVTISGGNIIGDRNDRIYSPQDVGLEGTHLLHVHSGRNVTIDGVNFVEGSKGALAIYSLGFRFNPDYVPTYGIKVINCSFTNIRRMGIALTDGSDILIEGNTFTNVGQPMSGSDGGEVGYAINIEAFRTRDDNGVLMENERAFDILITRNTEINSRVGFTAATIGQDITIDDNDIETRCIISLASGTKITNNRFNASAAAAERFAIFAAGSHSETVFDNEIANNSIVGYAIGIATDTNDINVHDNTITNGEIGIQLKDTSDSMFNNNIINVNGTGISATNTFVNNTSINENEVTAGGFHLFLTGFNNTTESNGYTISFEGNKFLNSKKITINNANGITFKNNEVTGGIELGTSANIDISSNTKIDPNDSDGIRLYGSHSDVSITNNNILEPSGAERFDCINNNSDTPNAIVLSGNTCATR